MAALGKPPPYSPQFSCSCSSFSSPLSLEGSDNRFNSEESECRIRDRIEKLQEQALHQDFTDVFFKKLEDLLRTTSPKSDEINSNTLEFNDLCIIFFLSQSNKKKLKIAKDLLKTFENKSINHLSSEDIVVSIHLLKYLRHQAKHIRDKGKTEEKIEEIYCKIRKKQEQESYFNSTFENIKKFYEDRIPRIQVCYEEPGEVKERKKELRQLKPVTADQTIKKRQLLDTIHSVPLLL